MEGKPVALSFDAGATLGHPVWSPDGERLALTTQGYAGLWVANAKPAPAEAGGTALQHITADRAAGFGVSWSPDGTALLARTAEWDATGLRRDAIAVFDAASGERTVLREQARDLRSTPKWIDGGAAVIVDTDEGIETIPSGAVSVAPLQENIPTAFLRNDAVAVVEAAGGVSEVRPFDDQRLLNVTPSPDGRRVAFEVVGGSLHVMNMDGTGLVDLGPGHRPSWSPDGAFVAFMVTEDDGENITAADLVIARASDGQRMPLTRTLNALEMNPAWSPDGATIAYDDLESGRVFLLPIASR